MSIRTVKGEEVVILDEDETGGFTSIPLARLLANVEDVIPNVDDIPAEFHKRPLLSLIAADTDDKMGWAKHKAVLAKVAKTHAPLKTAMTKAGL